MKLPESQANVARDLARALDQSKSWRDAGNVAVAIGAILLSAFPGGGAASTLVDKFGTKLFDADLETKFKELCTLVARLEPSLDMVAELDERLAAVSDVVMANDAIRRRMEEVLVALAPAAQATFAVSTVAGEQSFTDVAIENMRVLFEAYSGGVNHLNRVETKGGDVTFQSEGGRQDVRNSVFRGRDPGYGALGMDRISLEGALQTFNTPTGSGIRFGDNSRITFSPRGSRIVFGQPKKPD